MKHLIIFLLIASTAVAGLSHRADAAPYVVDPDQSELVVRLFKAGIAAGLAHNHVIRATHVKGQAEVNFENPSVSTIWAEAPAKALQADDPALRQKYNLEEQMSESDRQKVQKTMLSADQMDVDKYPSIRFESTAIEKLAEGRYLITGVMNMHGAKQQISFPAIVTQEEGKIRGQGSFRFKQSDYGITPYSAFFGSVRNQDEAMMNIDLVLVPQATPEKK
jgi:polyisoprenoid-binding protein YceI